MTDTREIIVLCSSEQRKSLYENWIGELPLPVRMVTSYGPDFILDDRVAMLITHEHRTQPTVSLCCRAMERDIPVLILSDGIVEYRNTWQRPDATPMSVFQPVQGHKFASFGPAQSRLLEAWGNTGVCEDVGCPRFDHLLGLRPRSRSRDGRCRVLVTTANTPAFTTEQEEKVFRSLCDIRSWGETQGARGGIELVWRLTGDWGTSLGIPDNRLESCSSQELTEVLLDVDAVVSTPSTVWIEAMLLGLPVAALDYTNSPQYVECAWRISARDHIAQTMADIASPPLPRMTFQRRVLQDALICTSPAAPRMACLVRKMLRQSAICKTDGTPLRFPPRMLEPAVPPPRVLPDAVDVPELYAAHNGIPSPRSRDSLVCEAMHLHRAYADEQQLRQSWITVGRIQRSDPAMPVVLYGAGRFLRKFLCAVGGVDGGPRVDAIVDDVAEPWQSMGGHAVKPPSELRLPQAPLVLLMTDAHTEAMHGRALDVFGSRTITLDPVSGTIRTVFADAFERADLEIAARGAA